MSAPVSTNLDIEPAAEAFLREHDALGDLPRIGDLVRACIPQATDLKVVLWDDWDELGRQNTVLEITLPSSYSLDLLRDQERRYYDELLKAVPFAKFPLFGLSVNFT